MERPYVCEKCDERLIHQPSKKCTCHKNTCQMYGTIHKCPLGDYDGDIQNGLRHGKGTWQMKSGKMYSGEWKNDMRHGHGEYRLPNGEFYNGIWSNGIRHGQGTYQYPNGDTYIGMWKNGLKHGLGKWETGDGIFYEGTWINDICTFNLTSYIEGVRSRKKRYV